MNTIPSGRSAVLRSYGIFIKDIGISRFLLIQAIGLVTGILTVISLSSLFGVLALFITNSKSELLEKLSRYGIASYIPQIVKDHLLGTALFVAFLCLTLKLLFSIAYSYYSTYFLENYAKRIRHGILDRYFESYGLLENDIKETEVLYFNHQLLRFVSYYVALLKANLELYNALFLFSFLVAISPLLSLFSALSLGFLFLLTRPIHVFSKRVGKEYNHYVFLVEQSINRITRGIEVLKTNNGKFAEFSKLEKHNSLMVEKAIGMDIGEKTILIVPEMMSLALIFCVLSLESSLDKNFIIAFLYSLLKLFGSLNGVNFLLNSALKLNNIPNEIHAYLDRWKVGPVDVRAFGEKTGRIQSILFEDLRLRRGGKVIFATESLVVEEGDRVQIAGPNGCGKSSLVKAFLGLMPYEGIIRVNGRDLKSIDREELFRRVSYIPQRFYLFNQSILENLRVGNDASREEIQSLLSILGMDPFLSGLRNGLDTVVAEDMKNLSGGQIQALSIARALLKPADAYIFDEYGNNLDVNIKEKVDDYLQNRMDGRILILITHLPIPFVNKRVDFSIPAIHAPAD